MTVAHRPLASIVVDNYNYARFLTAAIDSALAQTYPSIEVIVVDDGSTDESREVIASYAGQVKAILKSNGGQASAFNAGFEQSRGEIILFLDADDMLLPEAVSEAVSRFSEPDVVKVHWPLEDVDARGRLMGTKTPSGALPEGDLKAHVLEHGLASHLNPPTSGNAWSRRFLQRVPPMPEAMFRIDADAYLDELAPLFGHMKSVQTAQGRYRLHGANAYANCGFEERLARCLTLYTELCRFVHGHAIEWQLPIDDAWLTGRSWFHSVAQAVKELEEVVPPGEAFVLLDEDEWGTDDLLRGRPRIPFPEREGMYWGPPGSDEEATQELERAERRGVRFLIVAWPAFWWLDHYRPFAEHLRLHWRMKFESERVAAFQHCGV